MQKESAAEVRERLKKQRERWMRERQFEDDQTEIIQEQQHVQQIQERSSGFSNAGRDIMNSSPARSNYSHGSYQQQQQQHAPVLPIHAAPTSVANGGLGVQEMLQQLMMKVQNRYEKKMKEEYSKVKGTKQLNADLGGPAAEEIEETLHEQVMSNTCPICFELFLPPNNEPYILFPCGHTFCNTCINTYAKVKKLCPFCRKPYKQWAKNISLQNLILSANEKKDEVVKKLQAKQAEMLQQRKFDIAGSFNHPTLGATALVNEFNSMNMSSIEMPTSYAAAGLQLDNERAQEYLRQYQTIQIRESVMRDEFEEAQANLNNASSDLAAKEKAQDLMKSEKADCLKRLAKVQKELALIESFERNAQKEVEEAQEKADKSQQALRFIQEALGPLQQEKQKTRVLIESIAPHLASQLN